MRERERGKIQEKVIAAGSSEVLSVLLVLEDSVT